MQPLKLTEVVELLDQVLQTQPSNIYRETFVVLYNKGKAPPTDVVSEASAKSLARTSRS